MAEPLGVKVQVGINTTPEQFQKQIDILAKSVKADIQVNLINGKGSLGKDIGNSISKNISTGVKSAQVDIQKLQGTLDNLRKQYISSQTSAANPKFGGNLIAPDLEKQLLGAQRAVNMLANGTNNGEQVFSAYNQRVFEIKNSLSLFNKEMQIASKQNINFNTQQSNFNPKNWQSQLNGLIEQNKLLQITAKDLQSNGISGISAPDLTKQFAAVQREIDMLSSGTKMGAKEFTTYKQQILEINNALSLFSKQIQIAKKQVIFDTQQSQGVLDNLKAQNELLKLSSQNPKFNDPISTTNYESARKSILGMQSAIDFYNKGLLSAKETSALFDKNLLSTKNSTSLFSKEIITANQKLTNYNKDLSNSTGFKRLSSQMSKFLAANPKVSAYLNANTEAMSEWNAILNKNSGTIEEKRNAFAKFEAQMHTTGLTTQTLTDKLANLFRQHFDTALVMLALHKLQQALQATITNVEELDKSLVELSKVSDLGPSGLKAITQDAYELGATIGRTGREVIDATTMFKRAGYDLNTSLNELSKAALITTNIGDNIGTVEEASSALIAALRGFEIPAENVMDIVDSINEVSNNAPIDFDNITNGLERVSGVLAITGTSIDESIGLLTGGFARLRNIEKVSSGLNMIAARLRGVTDDGEELPELIPKIQAAFDKLDYSRLGIDPIQVKDVNGELKSTYDILSDLQKVWGNINTTERAFISEAVAGNRQNVVLTSIMEGWSDVSLAIQNSENATGSAMAENEKYKQSVEGIQNQIASLSQQLSNNIFSADQYKPILSFFKGFLQVLTDITGNKFVMTLLTGAGIGAGLKTLGAILKTFNTTKLGINLKSTFSGIGNFIKSFSTLGTILPNLRKEFTGSNIELVKLGQSMTIMSEAQKIAQVSALPLLNTQKALILQSAGMTAAQSQQALATTAISTAQAGATATGITFMGVLRGIGLAIASNPIGAIITGLTLATSAFAWYNQSQEEARQRAREAASAFSEEQNAIEEQVATFKDLRTQLSEGNLSHEEATDVRKQLMDIQDQIIKKYGDEAEAIDLVNDEIETQTALLLGMTKESANALLNKSETQDIRDLIEGQNSLNAFGTSYVLGMDVPDADGEIKKLLSQFEDVGISFNEDGGMLNIFFDGDLQSAQTQINNFLTAVREMGPEYEYALEQISGYSSGVLGDIDQDLRDNLNAYNEIIRAAIVAGLDSDGRLGIDTLYADLMNAQQKYLDASNENNEQTMADAVEQYNAAKQEIADFDIQDEGISTYVDTLIADMDALIEKYAELGNVSGGTLELDLSNISDNLSAFNEEISTLYSQFDMLNAAFDQLNETGYITADTFRQLSDNNLLQYIDWTTNSLNAEGQALLNSEAAARAKAKSDLQLALANDLAAIATRGLTDAEWQAQGTAAVASGTYSGVATAISRIAPEALNSAAAVREMNAALKDETGGKTLDWNTQKAQIHSVVSQYQNAVKAIDSISFSTNSASNAFGGYQNAAKGAAGANKELTDSIKEQKAVLEEQEDAINDLLEMTIKMIKKEKQLQKEALQDELDGYKKIIDARKELLRLREEEYDYQKELAEANKEVSDIESELIAIQFDDSEATQKRRLELQEQLTGATNSLNELQHDREVELSEDALDTEYERFEELQKAKIEAIDRYLDMEGQIRQDAIALIEARTQEFYNRLLEWNRAYNTGVDIDVVNAWNNAYNAMMAYNNGQIQVLSTLAQITARMKELEISANAAADAQSRAGSGGGSSGGGGTSNRWGVFDSSERLLQGNFSSYEEAMEKMMSRYAFSGNRVHSYAKGLNRARNSHLGAMDEPWLGDEMFIKTANGSRLKRIEVGDSILPANFTKTLTGFAKNPLDFIKNTLMGNISSVINNNASQPMTIDARIIVQGNVTEDMMPRIQAMMAQQKNNIFKEIQGNINLAGYRKSVVGT